MGVGGRAGAAGIGQAGSAGVTSEGGKSGGGGAASAGNNAGGVGGSTPGGPGGGAGNGGQGAAGGLGGTGGSSGGAPAVEGPSCEGGLDCAGVSCCSTIPVPGGTFPMGRGLTGTDSGGGDDDELPEHPATVAPFMLDRFEVTVGRFRKYYEANVGKPMPGVGANANVPGTGWKPEWGVTVGKSDWDVVLNCHDTLATWTPKPGPYENKPINCVTWYGAFAFCAWDGGRLPTEAEWEFAAAGGPENRLVPWGNKADGNPKDYAAFDCMFFGDPSCEPQDLPEVGILPAGAGRWGHQDLSSGVMEWAYDWFSPHWYAEGGNTCVNCVNPDPYPPSVGRVLRGGGFLIPKSYVRSAARLTGSPNGRSEGVGIRCARNL